MSFPALTLNAPPALDLQAVTERDAIAGTADLLKNCSDVTDASRFLEAVMERQRINPPVLGNGIALPHARTMLVREIVCVAGRCAAEVPFGPEGKPVRLVFLFGIPPNRIGEYLAVTAALVKRLRRPEVVEGLLTAATDEDFRQWLA